VSGDGTTAVIGAENDSDPNDSSTENDADEFVAGPSSASVFISQEGGQWTEEATLAPEDGDDEDFFGGAVGVSDDGTTAVIGDQSDSNWAGSAYVFQRESVGEWAEIQKLAPEDGDDDDDFGESVGVSSDGTTAVIGARNDEDPNGDGAGSAYVFQLEE
jgi:hypothetical protein